MTPRTNPRSGRRFPLTESAYPAQPGLDALSLNDHSSKAGNYSSSEGMNRKCWASCATSTAPKVGGPTFPGSEGNRSPIAAEAKGTHIPRVRGGKYQSSKSSKSSNYENKNKNSFHQKEEGKRKEQGKRKENVYGVHSKKDRSDSFHAAAQPFWRKKTLSCLCNVQQSRNFDSLESN